MRESKACVVKKNILKEHEKKFNGFSEMTGIQVMLYGGQDLAEGKENAVFPDCSCLRGLIRHSGKLVLARSICGLLYGMIRQEEGQWIIGPVLTSREKSNETANYIIRFNCREDVARIVERVNEFPVISAEKFEYYLLTLFCAVTEKDITEIDFEHEIKKNIFLFPAQNQIVEENNDRLEGCVEYIRNNINESLSLTAIAKYCGYNPAYLSRKFKKIYGINLNRFIIETKLSAAADYLKYSDKTLSEISENLCFASQSHFQNAFKNVYRMTPMEFRKQRKRTRPVTVSVKGI